MGGARWLRVVEIFEAAERQAPEQREAFLNSECGGDRALLEEVASLLASHGAEHPLLPSSPLHDPKLAEPDGDPVGELPAGAVFGHYTIERTLGVGGMGEVYLARDDRLQRKVAIKLLGSWIDLDPRMVERFRKEALAASALRHPNIPVVFEAGVVDGRHFIATEYIEGEPLSKRLRRGPPLDWRAAVDIAETLARALAVAHAAGIVHRDVKPGNILIDREGRPHLVDFGIVKLLAQSDIEASTGAQLTMFGAQLGTPGYMAPEQVYGESVGPAADVWSLAAVLHEMVTGKPPSAGTQRQRITRSCPTALSRVLDHALQADPKARFANAGGFADALAALLRGGSLRIAVLPGARPGWLWGGAGLLALGIASASALFGWWRPAAAGPPSLAVLPFENLTSDPNEAYFALGIQDELLTRLSRISGLRVLDRHATEKVAAQPSDLPALASRLGVANLLEGSVQRQGVQVVVRVRLIEAASQTLQWAQRYEREAGDVFDIERDIAEGVSERLRARLLPREHSAVAVPDTASPEAHIAALRGRYLYRRGDEESLKSAVAEFQNALRFDPNYAQAYADLAMALHNLDAFGSVSKPSIRAESRAAAQHAVYLAPDLPDAHVALAWAFLMRDWDLANARHEFELALALAPNSPRALNGLAALLADLGDFGKSERLIQRVRELDPLSGITATNLSNLLLAKGALDDAARLATEALRLDPTTFVAHANLAYIALLRGKLSEAHRQAAAEAVAEQRELLEAMIALHEGGEAQAKLIARRFARTHGQDFPFDVAVLFAHQGDADAAFQWLERSFQARDSGTIEILLSPDLRRLAGDPRFGEFCRRLGIPMPQQQFAAHS